MLRRYGYSTHHRNGMAPSAYGRLTSWGALPITELEGELAMPLYESVAWWSPILDPWAERDTLPLEYKLQERSAKRHLGVTNIVNDPSLFGLLRAEKRSLAKQPLDFLGRDPGPGLYYASNASLIAPNTG